MVQERFLIEQSLKGNPKAQQQLYDKYSSHWFMICLRYLNNRTDALDVLQNALINIYSKLDQFSFDKGSFSSWSSRIVVNDAIMFIRKRKPSVELENLSAERFELNYKYETPIQKLSAEELTNLIQALPEGYRLVFNMYVIEGYKHIEIAKALNISVGTSKSQLFKAKKVLKQQIELVI